MHFIQNLNLDFHSFLDLYLNGSGSSIDNNRWYRIVGAIGSKIYSFNFVCLLKVRMNLNGIQTLYDLMDENAWIMNSRFSQIFNLVPYMANTDIS